MSAASVAPCIAEAATAFHRRDYDRAIDTLCRGLDSSPANPDLLNNIAVNLRAQGRHREAAVFLRRALAADPGHPDYNYNLGNALLALNELAAAETAYRLSLSRRPAAPEVVGVLATLLRQTKRPDEAATLARAGLVKEPGHAGLHNTLGAALFDARRYDAALQHFRIATRCDPRLIAARTNAAMTLTALCRFDEAAASAREAIALAPDSSDAHAALGQALVSQGRIAEALPQFEQALSYDRGHLDARMGLSRAYFLAGRYAEAWRLYAVRWERRDNPKPPLQLLEWTTDAGPDARIIVYAEQGFGDTIQFCRYLEPLSRLASHVVFACQEPLLRLMRDSLGSFVTVTSLGEAPRNCSHCVALLDLPQRLGLAEPYWPATGPYLRADGAGRVRRARPTQRLIGLTWAGNPDHMNDRFRSLPFAKLLDLAGRFDARFVSLQKGPAAAAIAAAGAETLVEDISPHLHTFAETASVLVDLDLIISADTATAHLAAALGRPTWTLLPGNPDWRWGTAGSATPWYPSMRLFRQSTLADWSEPVASVRDALAALVR